jgi:hypothetical protein
MIAGYKKFVTEFTQGAYQYNRLKGFFGLLDEGNFISLESKGFGNLWLFVRMIAGDWPAIRQMIQRLARFSASPANVYYVFKGLALALWRRPRSGGFGYFQFWFFAWSNAVLKYRYISDSDFDIDSVGDDFDIRNILPEAYGDTADENIPQNKIQAQLRTTKAQLGILVDRRQGAGGAVAEATEAGG